MRAIANTFFIYVLNFGKSATLFALGSIIVLAFLFVVALSTADGFLSQPFLYVYTLAIIVFQLSRIAAAMLYLRSFESVYMGAPRQFYEPTISFVIPCKNEEGAIAHTVTKCFQANYPKEKIEVIVINDGSTDDTIHILRSLQKNFPQLTVVDWKENKGKRHGMAEGFRRAKGEIVIQLDSDSYIEPRSLREFVQPFQNATIGAVCAHTDPANVDFNWLTKMQAAYYFLAFRILKAAESTFFTVFCCCGCASAYRKDIVLPMLDEWLRETFLGKPVMWDEDRALTNVVLRLGYNTIYADTIQAYTIVPETCKMFLKQQIRWNKAWLTSSINASKFIWKQRPFVAYSYFFPHMLFTLVAPFITLRLLFILPLTQNSLPVLHVSGLLVYTALMVIYYISLTSSRVAYQYWPYVFLWSAISAILFSVLFIYALITIQDRRWGTR